MADATDETLRVIAPPPLLFAAGLALAVLLDRVVPFPPAPRLPALALFLILSGLALLAWAFVSFRRARTTVMPYGRATYLVPDGPYQYTRNPMYLGMTSAYVGAALALGSAWAFVLLPVVLVVLHVGVIRREEEHLEARFGEDYLAYKRRVRRWL